MEVNQESIQEAVAVVQSMESWTSVVSWGSEDDGNNPGFQDFEHTAIKFTLSA